MNVKISIADKKILIALEEEGSLLENVSFPVENNLTETLLPSIDKLLKKRKIFLQDIEKFDLVADVEDSCTSYRIIKTAVDSLNWAKGATVGKHVN